MRIKEKFLPPFLPSSVYFHKEAELSDYWSHWRKTAAATAAAKSLQSCPTLCNPIDGLPPGSPVPGILQAKTLEWVAISFSNAWKSKMKVKLLSCIQLFVTSWTAAYQAPPSMGFFRQEYWSGVPLPSLEERLIQWKITVVGWTLVRDLVGIQSCLMRAIHRSFLLFLKQRHWELKDRVCVCVHGVSIEKTVGPINSENNYISWWDFAMLYIIISFSYQTTFGSTCLHSVKLIYWHEHVVKESTVCVSKFQGRSLYS